ncbi:MAG: NAD(P)/FAD-dependent oxidoreductase [Ignavibacteriales bacterium]|nr:NAD(P)/FAD-dependent oxidoreductase [Ignavibacteriales bacterium]
MYKATILILGGGVGGIVTANNLRKKLPKDYKIILIEKNKEHSLAASYLWLMVDKRTPSQISSPLKKLVSNDVEIVYEEVQKINTEEKFVTLPNSNIKYDYLVISLGADLEYPTLQDESKGTDVFSFYNLDGSIKLRDKLKNFRGGKIAVMVSSLPYKCPGAPFEAAMLISDFLKKKSLNVEVNIFTPEPQPLPVAGPQLGQAVIDLITSKQINFYPLHKISSVDTINKKLLFDNNNSYNFDILITIPNHKTPKVVVESRLTNEASWIPVNRNTMETKFENVFAIGDITTIPLPGRWNPDKPMNLPKAGVFAHSQAIFISEIIAAKILGKESKEIFCGDGFCMLEAGEELAGFAYGDFYASPHPDVKMKQLGKSWHLGKVLFEKWWLAPFGLKKSILKMMLRSGGKILRIPIDM